MSADDKKYWRSLEEYERGGSLAEQEEAEFGDTPLRNLLEPGRRDFLRAAGFVFAGAALTGCSRAPVERAIPLLHQPEGITPGRPYYYAAVCSGCSASCGMLSKCLDGRPIKLEGNPEHPVSKGGLCAVGQASLLGLYDSLRLGQPMAQGKNASWREVDEEISGALDELRKQRRAVRVLTQTVTSPALSAQIRGFLAGFPDARHVVYDVLSASPILDAHGQTHGARVLPRYLFGKAAVIASFDADFLGTWISPVEFTEGYSEARNVEGKPARPAWHVQFESRMSLTGTKADRRIKLAPAEIPAALEQLAVKIARKAGSAALPAAGSPPPVPEDLMEDLAGRLWDARGRCLVVCGAERTDAQVLCNFVNHLLGNYGATLDLTAPSNQKQGDDRALLTLMDEIKAGHVGALFIHGLNPAADLAGGDELVKALAGIPLLVSLAPRLDETSTLARYLCPACDPLETWDDSEPVAGVAAISQPAIRPIRQARAAIESFARWSGTGAPAFELVKGFWKESVYPRQKEQKSFDAFWEKSVEAGFATVMPQSPALKPFDLSAVKPIDAAQPSRNGLAVVLYANAAMLDGRHAYNPWLQELPDPVTKATWDNYASLAPATAERMAIHNGDVVRLQISGTAIELPVLIQPGQHEKVVAVALGYGRSVSARFANTGPKWLDRRPTLGPTGMIGVNAASFLLMEAGSVRYWRDDVKVTSAGKRQPVTVTQEYNSLTVPRHLDPGGGPRPIVQETTLEALGSGEAKHESAHQAPALDLWPDDHPFSGPPLGHDHRPERMYGLLGLRDRVPGGEQCTGDGQGRGVASPRNALDPHRSLLLGTARRRRSRASADAVPALRARSLRDRVSRACHGPQRRRTEPADLQSLRRHPLLRKQLPLQGSPLQLVRILAERSPGQPDAQSGCDRAVTGRHGEVQLLRAAHPGRQGRGQAPEPQPARWRDPDRLPADMPRPGHRLRRSQRLEEQGRAKDEERRGAIACWKNSTLGPRWAI